MAAGILDLAPPAWLGADAPESASIVVAQCSLVRNFDDFPFPEHCGFDERKQIEERLIGALESAHFSESGQYIALEGADPGSIRFLAERRLITMDMVASEGPRGVYVSHDQSLCIMVNGSDHVCIRAQRAGQHLAEALHAVNQAEAQLRGMLDFAFDDKLGFLTAPMDVVGTGLKASLLLHLPALQATTGAGHTFAGLDRQQVVLHGIRLGQQNTGLAAGASDGSAALTVSPGQGLEAAIDQALYSDINGPLCGRLDATSGDMVLLVNRSTLGVSEDEIVFHVRHTAEDLLDAERRARDLLLGSDRTGVEDRVGRALGIGRYAHILGFDEAIEVLSSLRLGAAAGLHGAPELRILNGLLLDAQGAQLEAARGEPCDGLQLSIQRASLFRARLSATQ